MTSINSQMVDDMKARVQAQGGVVTDVVGMVRLIDRDGKHGYLFLMDGADGDGKGNVVVIAGMVRALDTYIEPFLKANFGG